MNSIERFRKGEQLTANQMNGLVDSLNSLVGVRASLNHAPRGYHQVPEITMPVEPAGGLYDRKRGLDALAEGLPDCTQTITGWLGHAAGVQAAEKRISGGSEESGQVFTLCMRRGGTLWQKVTTNSVGECVKTCMVYKEPGCAPGCSRLWNTKNNEGGIIWRRMGQVVESPVNLSECLYSAADKLTVLHDNDFPLPIVPQGTRMRYVSCITGVAPVLDSSHAQAPGVRNIALHAPENDFKLGYYPTEVIIWQNQIVPPAPGGWVYNGPGAVNGEGFSYGSVKWTGHKPHVMTTCSWTPGEDCQVFAECCVACISDLTAWLNVKTDKYGSVLCSNVCVRPTSDGTPPGGERFWNPDECQTGELWQRIGHTNGRRAITDVDMRLPILTQNAEITHDQWQEKAVRLVRVEDNSTPNRYVKRLLSCACGLRFCDRGCAIVLVAC